MRLQPPSLFCWRLSHSSPATTAASVVALPPYAEEGLLQANLSTGKSHADRRGFDGGKVRLASSTLSVRIGGAASGLIRRSEGEGEHGAFELHVERFGRLQFVVDELLAFRLGIRLREAGAAGRSTVRNVIRASTMISSMWTNMLTRNAGAFGADRGLLQIGRGVFVGRRGNRQVRELAAGQGGDGGGHSIEWAASQRAGREWAEREPAAWELALHETAACGPNRGRSAAWE